MKLLLTAFCASFMILPAFASECEKGKCDKEKTEKSDEGTLAHCGKCEDKDKEKEADKDKKEEKKEEEKLASKCKDKCKDECDKETKDEGTLA